MIGPQHEPVAAVIPAHNEAQQIARVIDVLCQVSDLLQITVVDDSSSDNTSDAVQSYCERDPRIRLLRLPTNRGKGGAMAAGADASASDLIVFLDADLVGLRAEHVLALIEPVRDGVCSMALGLFTHGRRLTDWSHRLTPFLSGQRCLRWSLFRSTPDLATARAGVEIALSLHAWRHGYRVMPVPWYGVTHVMKHEKRGWLRGKWSYLPMYGEIVRYLARHPTVDGTLTDWAKARWALKYGKDTG
jgi:glycosyltransferase involved in cell wall biosynthesis